MMKILIDNGHGEDTAGKRSPDGLLRECRYTREIARDVVDELVSLGYDAELLVPEDGDVSLPDRVKRVNGWCDRLGAKQVVLVSIHCNAAGNGDWMNARGWSAYTSNGQTQSDRLATFLYDYAKRSFAGHKIREDNTDGDPDWESNFYILKHTLCVAVLTENFFMDNKEDVSYLLSLEGRRQIVNVHVNAIGEYVDIYGTV